MPIYEYECTNHGEFELLRSMREAGDTGDCPECHSACRRIVSAPHLAGMPKAAFIAHERNERSRHDPRTATRHVCSSGCKHAGSPPPSPNQGVVKKYTGARPWVVEHG